MRLGATAQPKFIGTACCNTRQVEIRFRKLDDLPDAILVAPGHDVIPPARIGRFHLQPPPVDVPGFHAECLRRLVGVGEFYFIIASQLGLSTISPSRATNNRIAQNTQRLARHSADHPALSYALARIGKGDG